MAKFVILQAGTNGAPLVPTEIAQEMIKKVSEQSGIFGKDKSFTTNGKLDIVVEDKIGEAEIVDEGLDLPDVDPEFHVESLDTKRVGASIKMTKKMVHDSENAEESTIENWFKEVYGATSTEKTTEPKLKEVV
ncbi:phage major capsid protein [Bacillus toyonensis]|uniref:phage major capsid protein n=1 Tax=Bacillus toyonensis TaxID=155322 RepID=UPI000BEFB432|nr:phage major capsid protein [Bacillus toyonensis]PEL01327.1 phage major capsid protein [Bacillus toyonensis]